MTDSPSIHYETVATAFHVLDIAEPLVTSAPPDWTVEDVLSAIMEDRADYSENWFALVRNDQAILGFVAGDFIGDEPDEKFDGPMDGSAGQYCHPITADQIVAGSLPLLDLIPLFQEHFFFFVLNKNDLTHVVSFIDLDKLPVRLCLFTLLTGLEAELIRLLSRSHLETERNLARLPEHRLRSAREWCRTRFREDQITPEKVLRATTLADKVTMLLSEPAFMGQLPFGDEGQAEAFFAQLRELRNRIAHSDSILTVLDRPESFDQLLSQLRHVTDVVATMATEPSDNSSI